MSAAGNGDDDDEGNGDDDDVLVKGNGKDAAQKDWCLFSQCFFDFGCCVAETKDDMQGVSDMMRQR